MVLPEIETELGDIVAGEVCEDGLLDLATEVSAFHGELRLCSQTVHSRSQKYFSGD